MTIDPQAAKHIQLLAGTGFGSMHMLAPAMVREGMRRMVQALGPGKPVHSVEDRTIATDTGGLAVRIYRSSAAETRPIMVFFHGGGFVLGDLDTHDGLARSLAAAADCVVVSVDYPLAPEHKYPAARNSAYAATKWVSTHAAEIGGDPGRLLVAGDSAGGNLAAVVSLDARDHGGPRLVHQVLIYPGTDMRMGWPSLERHAQQLPLTRAGMHWFVAHYLRNDADKLDWRASPLARLDLFSEHVH